MDINIEMGIKFGQILIQTVLHYPPLLTQPKKSGVKNEGETLT